jgi:hypothetical protein
MSTTVVACVLGETTDERAVLTSRHRIGERAVPRGTHLDEAGVGEGGLKLGECLAGAERAAGPHEEHERVLAPRFA